MYIIMRLPTSEVLEERVRRVVARRHRDGRRLPEYFLAAELVGQPPRVVDGFLVMGSRCVGAGELVVVTRLGERPGVRYES